MQINANSYGILIDFDGTITTVDTLQYLLDKYGMPDWRELDRQAESGTATIMDAMTVQMKSLRISPTDAVKEIVSVISLRDGFQEFMEIAKRKGITTQIVSGGFIEIIEPYLRHFNIECEISALTISCLDEAGGWEIGTTVERIAGCTHHHCKCRSEEWLRGVGKKTIFIGDGITDYCIAERAHILFALAGDALERKAIREDRRYFSFTTFYDVIHQLDWNE